jgi:hypothetical protein
LNIDEVKESVISQLTKVGLVLLPPNDRNLAEEIYRTCLTSPTSERAYLLPTTSVVVNSRLVAQCNRIFDITTSSGHSQALYDIEELRKLPRLGYSLLNGYMMHTHPESYNPSASVADLAAFITTDAALGISLNYLVVSATKDIVCVKAFSFKRCHECVDFCGFLKDAPLVDSRIDQDVKKC